jgi:hypothetical protein
MNLFRFEPIFTAYPLENKRDVSGGFVFSSPSCSIHCFINKLARLLRGPIWATIVEIRRFCASEGLAARRLDSFRRCALVRYRKARSYTS